MAWIHLSRTLLWSSKLADLSFRIQNNEVEYRENLLFDILPQNNNFYSIGNMRETTNNFQRSGQAYFEMYFVFSQEYTYYERNVYSFFDMFGVLGGIYEMFSIGGYFMVTFITSRMFNNSLLSSLYQINKKSSTSNKTFPKKSMVSSDT